MQFINLEKILITFSFLIPRDNRCNQIPWMKHTRNRDHYRETIVANQNVAVFHDLIDNVRHGTIVSLCHRSTFRWKEEISIYIKQKLHIVDFFNQKIIITFRSIAQVPSPLIEDLFFSREKKTVFNGTVIEHDDHWRWRKEKEYEIVDGNYDSRKRLTLCTHVSLYFIIVNTYIYISILRDSCHNV